VRTAVLFNKSDYKIIPYSAKHEEFFWQLHVQHNKSYIEKHFGWNEAETRKTQQARVAESDVFIITMNNKPIGCYFITNQKDSYKLARFFLIDEMQGKGLGRDIVRKILADYASSDKPVTINVWQGNPVIRFWEKMGFRRFSEDEHFIYMRYPA
jgi:GNAT superfamily N-acetyltransferase